jgi:hypothetical protein
MAEHSVTHRFASVMAKISTKRSASVAAVVRKFIFLLCAGLGLLLCQVEPASAATPNGTIELSGGKVAAGIGYKWGSGTLIFQGKRYPLNISGIGLGSVGVNEYTASGHVTGLRCANDINGIFTAVGTGLTLGGGASVAEMKNENGVTIQLDSTTEGLSVSVAATGVQVSIAQ